MMPYLLLYRQSKKHLWAVFLCLIFLCGLSPARAAKVDNEKHDYGTACSSEGASGVDWDTIFQCSGGVWKRASLSLGNSSVACDASHAGVLQWNGTAFEACNGTSWQTMGQSGSSFPLRENICKKADGSFGYVTINIRAGVCCGGDWTAPAQRLNNGVSQYSEIGSGACGTSEWRMWIQPMWSCSGSNASPTVTPSCVNTNATYGVPNFSLSIGNTCGCLTSFNYGAIAADTQYYNTWSGCCNSGCGWVYFSWTCS